MANKEAIERVKKLNNLSASISTEPIDHDKLFNRDEANQHPISAITNLEAIITELKGANEYIGELESVEVGSEQTELTMFVLKQKGRTPRLNDLIRIKDRAEMWRHNSETWEYYTGGVIADIPIATTNVVGGIKVDQEKFVIDEEGYLNYNITNDENHQLLQSELDKVKGTLKWKSME